MLPILLSLLGTASALTASSGCGTALSSSIKKGGTGSSNTITIQSNGTTRTFLLHVPTNYAVTSPRGLIFSFAGRGKTASQQETLSGFSDPFFNPNLLAVYPQGLSNQFEGHPASVGVDDVHFTLDMLSYVEGKFCVDTDAVYSSGKSNGGTKFAAFIGCSGAYYQDITADGSCSPDTVPIGPCSPSRKVPILEFHGSADATIPYDGGERRGDCLPSVPHFVRNWTYLDGIQNSTTTSLYSGNVQKYEYEDGSGGNLGLVTHYWVNGLTHAWPSTLPNGDSSTPTYFNATSIIMDFFSKYPLK